MILESI